MSIVLIGAKDINFQDYINRANRDVVAVSKQLSAEQIIPAYKNSIFPWPYQGDIILWTSPNPRAILYPNNFKISRSLKKAIQCGQFEYKIDTNFEAVMRNCASVKRKHEAETWITENMIDVYCNIYKRGSAHSFEIYLDGNLVGGLYGIGIGRIFIGESMFSLVSEASKFAMSVLVSFCKQYEFKFIDCQLQNSHLSSLGAVDMERNAYLTIIRAEKEHHFDHCHWDKFATSDISPKQLIE